MKIALDDMTWREARFSQLCAAMRWDTATCLGVLALFWHRTRSDGIVTTNERFLFEYLPCSTELRMDFCRALEAGGYVKRDKRGDLTIQGNADFMKLRRARSAAGKLGQAETMRRLRDGASRAVMQASRPKPGTQAFLPGTEPTAEGRAENDCWAYYQADFKRRYGDHRPPPRNERNGPMMRFFIERVGASDAVCVLRVFMSMAHYEADRHALHNLVRDAERLRDLTLRTREVPERVPA